MEADGPGTSIPLSRPPAWSGLSYSQTVFAFFLAAALIPLVILSAVTVGLSARMVDAVVTENVAAGIELTGRKLDALTESVGRSVVAVAARPELGETLSSGGGFSEKALLSVAAAAKERFRDDAPPVNAAVLDLEGKTIYSTTGLPASLPSELIEAVRENPAGISVTARRMEGRSDRYAAFYEATAVIGASGECVGYAAAEIPRETLKTVLAPLPPVSDLTIVDSEGIVAFSASDPDSEGKPLSGPAEPEDGRSYRGSKLSVTAAKPDSLVSDLVESLTLTAAILSLLCALLALGGSLALSRRVSGPVTRLIAATKEVAEGNLEVRLTGGASGELRELMGNFNRMVGELDRLFVETMEEQELLRQAELESLRSQINPHFFFNALSSIDALARLGSCAEISRVTATLGKLLRGSISGKAREETLRRSVEETRHYLVIEKIRFADRFSWSERIGPGTEDAVIPHLALQTLVENALIHGIEPSPEAAELLIESEARDEILTVRVCDSGVGMGESRLAALNRALREGERPESSVHIGLRNLNRRIALEYGDDYGLSLREREGGGLVAEMRLPLRREERCTG